jgi:hypothetical protein
MTLIRLPIVRWVNDHNPGIVECHLTDASGHIWSIIDKLPIFTETNDLDANSSYPQPGVLACEVVETKIDQAKRTVLIVDTSRPWGVESVEGKSCFEVFEEQIKGYETQN